MSANNYTAASGKCAFGFSPLPEISGISIVMHVSELFVNGKCIIDSLVRCTFARGRHSVFYATLTCRITGAITIYDRRSPHSLLGRVLLPLAG